MSVVSDTSPRGSYAAERTSVYEHDRRETLFVDDARSLTPVIWTISILALLVGSIVPIVCHREMPRLR